VTPTVKVGKSLIFETYNNNNNSNENYLRKKKRVFEETNEDRGLTINLGRWMRACGEKV